MATVDSEGNVTIVGEGSTAITAITAETDQYESASAEFALTVSNDKILYTVSGYTAVYDGEEHSITVSVDAPEGASVSYGTSGDDISLAEAPAYTDAGTYTVYYEIAADGYDTVTGTATVDLSSYPDADEVSDWAEEGMSRAVASGLINGTVVNGITLLDATDPCTRAMGAQIIYKFILTFES